MIIDRETFTDIAKHLESASEGLLRAATGVATLCPEMDPGEPASLRWLALDREHGLRQRRDHGTRDGAACRARSESRRGGRQRAPVPAASPHS